MSYNIDNFKVKELKGLYIPLVVIQALEYTEVQLLSDNKIKAEGLNEMFDIEGVISDGNVLVSKITTGSEGSGTTWDDFTDMLKQSKGTLRARVVWEGGDTIEDLVCIDGVVSVKELE